MSPTIAELVGYDDDTDEEDATMQAQRIDGMFHGLRFEKTAKEIVDKARAKVTALRGKIAERAERIKKLRAEYEIDDAALIELLTQARKAAQRREDRATFSYSNSTVGASGGDKGPQERTIGAGAVNFLLTESDFLEAEKEQVKRLELIAGNLRDLPDRTLHAMPPGGGGSTDTRPAATFQLTFEELEYLGF